MQISVRGNLEHLPDTCDINCGESNYMYEVNATNVNFKLSSVTIKLGFDGLSPLDVVVPMRRERDSECAEILWMTCL